MFLVKPVASVRMKMEQIEKPLTNLLCCLFLLSCVTRNVDFHPGEEWVLHCLFWQYPHGMIEDKHLVQQIQGLLVGQVRVVRRDLS